MPVATENATGSQRRAEMQIVTDSGTDVWLPPEQAAELNIHIVPLIVTLEGKSYREGVDIQPEEFYRLLGATDSLPITSQPSAGVFAEMYRQLAVTDPDILSIHMTSGLSGTFNASWCRRRTLPSLIQRPCLPQRDGK
jgi:DegV family protein with EDD domain